LYDDALVVEEPLDDTLDKTLVGNEILEDATKLPGKNIY